MRPDGRLQTLCFLVVLHISVSRRKQYETYEVILAWRNWHVKKEKSPLDKFYHFDTYIPGRVSIFVKDRKPLPGIFQLVEALLTFAVDATVNLIFLVDTAESMMQFLLAGSNAAGIVAMDLIKDHALFLRHL